MDILSYRGPDSPGGVSAALSRILETSRNSWWHLSQGALFLRRMRSLDYICNVSEQIVEGHYRYCNNFLWPVLHDMPEHAYFCAEDRISYQQFNLAFAANILRCDSKRQSTSYFIQDYQLALLASSLFSRSLSETALFWHVPWPETVQKAHVEPLAEIARGMLFSKRIGFHIDEYARNFLSFVANFVPEFRINHETQTITSVSDSTVSEIVVHPLGLDVSFWKKKLESKTAEHVSAQQIASSKYVLSVDRADYTKGVIERLKAIDEFFKMYPCWRNEVTFVQVCQRTRPGLDAFDRYWDSCLAMASKVNQSWQCDAWKPIVWVDEPVTPDVLAALYRKATVMLVNPLRDGLNLTAKKFVACAGDIPGSLLLSKTAGAWHEFKDHVVPVSPQEPMQVASSLAKALALPEAERKKRLVAMRTSLELNSLLTWWKRFTGAPPHECNLVTILDESMPPVRSRLSLEEFDGVAV